MISEAKISDFIALLIEETMNDKIEWSINQNRNVDSLDGEKIISGVIYSTEYLEETLRLYKYTEPIQIDEFEYQRKIFFRLEFINSKGVSLWGIPRYIRELYDLYETVQIKSSKLDVYFDKINKINK